jgi:hypothetical protein
MALVAFSATGSHTDVTRPAALRGVRPQDGRQPPGSGNRFAAFGCEHSPASSGTVAIAEIVAHTACTRVHVVRCWHHVSARAPTSTAPATSPARLGA